MYSIYIYIWFVSLKPSPHIPETICALDFGLCAPTSGKTRWPCATLGESAMEGKKLRTHLQGTGTTKSHDGSMVLEYLPTFTPYLWPSFVGKYSIHGSYGNE